MFYQRYDNSKETCLVLLHSGGMAGVEWEPQIKVLSTYADLLVPDLPGHGQSLLDDGDALSISLMGAAVVDMLAQEKIAKAAFLGSSMGGAVALWIAVNHPALVEKLVIYRMGYTKNSETYAQTVAMANPDYWRQYGLHQWLSQLHLPQGGEDAWETVIANVSAVMNPEYSEHNHTLATLSELSTPTLLIAGDRDPLVPLETLAAMYAAIPDCALWVMPNASHITGSNTWRSKPFAEEVIRFLR